jgi:hypothetical protein
MSVVGMAIRVRVLGTRWVPDPWGRAWVPFFTRGLCPYPTRCQAGTGRGSDLTHGYPVGTRQTITEQNISVSLFQQFSPTFGPAQNSSSGHLVTLSRSKPVTRRSPIPPDPHTRRRPSPRRSARQHAALGPPQSRRRTPPSPPWCPPAGCTTVPATATQPPPPPPLRLLRTTHGMPQRISWVARGGHNAAASHSGCRGSSPNLAVAASQAW